jgi:hypothetical protein
VAALPGFTTRARPTSKAHFGEPLAEPFAGRRWMLWAFSFLGRFQPAADDEINAAPLA